VKIEKDRTLTLVEFSGNDGGRKLETGTNYPHSKAFLQQVLALPDPHVSFYKFFKL
jgi:hypothetical protein